MFQVQIFFLTWIKVGSNKMNINGFFSSKMHVAEE